MEYTYLIIFIIVVLLHYNYTMFSLRTINITIKSKYVLYDKLYKLIVSSTNGEVFEVSNNLWLWKWTAVELWDKLKEGSTYSFKIYGYRYPVIDFFPNIVEIN